MLKVREAISSSRNYTIDGALHVNEYVLSARKQGKKERIYNGNKRKQYQQVQLT